MAILILMRNLDLLKLLFYAMGSNMRYNESIPSKTHLQKEMFQTINKGTQYLPLNNSASTSCIMVCTLSFWFIVISPKHVPSDETVNSISEFS